MSASIVLGAPVASVQSLQGMARFMGTAPMAHPAMVADIVRIAFDGRQSPQVHQTAFEMMVRGPYFNPGLLNVYQQVLVGCAQSELPPLTKLPDHRLAEVANEALQKAQSALEERRALEASRAMIAASYLVYRAAQSDLVDRRNDFEKLVMDHPSAITQVPSSFAFNEAGLMVFWDRCERPLIFDDLFSTNPTRVRFAQGKVMMLANAERASGSKGIGVKTVAEAMGSKSALRALEKRMCPERNVTRQGVRQMLLMVAGPTLLTLDPTQRDAFIEDLTSVILDRIRRMTFFELRDMFFAEGAASLTPEGVPLKLATQAVLDKIDRMVEGREISMGHADIALENMRAVVSYLADALHKCRDMPKGYLDFLNPYHFIGTPPQGKAS